MKELSIVSQRVLISPVRQMFDLAAGMEDVVSFTLGEPDFFTPQNVVDAAITALQNGAHKYTANAGILPLRQAISEKIQKTHGMCYDPLSQVMVTTGGTGALVLAMQCMLNPGDEFIMSDPCWTNYSRQVEICSATPVFVPVYADDSFTFRPEDLEKAITPKTKGFILNSPANPTGGMAGREALEKLAEIAVRHDLFVISDEVYDGLVYDGKKPFSIATLPGMAERTVIVNSFSKTYAMTGWRVGFAVGPEKLISNMVKLQEYMVACVNSAAQYGALAALQESQDSVKAMLDTYAQRREYVVNTVAQIKGLHCFVPQGAFYAFIDISATGLCAEEFAKDLLMKNKVIVVPGHAFGNYGKNFVRICFATSMENIREGLERIGQYMKAFA